jgi:uncharacterized membrane protein
MLSSVLTSERAIAVNIAIIRTFVRLRHLLVTHEELAHRLEKVEWRQAEQEGKVQHVFETIQHLIEALAEEPEKRRFGFPTGRAQSNRGQWSDRNQDRQFGSTRAASGDRTVLYRTARRS